MINERVLRTRRRRFGPLAPGVQPSEFFTSLWSRLERLRRSVEAHDLAVMTGCGAVLFLSLLFYGFWIPLTPGRLARPTSNLIKDLGLWQFVMDLDFPVAQTSGMVAAVVIVATLITFVAYACAVGVAVLRKPSPKSRQIVVWGAILFAFISVWLLPNFNTDVFNYIMRGRMAAVHDSNPYYHAADEFPDDPLHPYASHRYTSMPGAKFPGWMHINSFLASVAGDDPAQVLLVYRLGLLAFHLANMGLLALILLKLSPGGVWAGIVVYAWNPIVFLNGVSKTDTVMVFYLLVAVWLLTRGRKSLPVIAMGLSVAVKLVTAPLVLVYFMQDLSLRRWRQLAVSGILLVGTIALIYLPFWEGTEILSQHWLAMGKSGSSASGGLLAELLPVVFIGLVLWVGLTLDGSIGRLLEGWVYVMLFFSLLMTRIGMAWYLMTFIALVALVQRRHMLVLMGFIAFSSFMFNVWYSTFSGSFSVDELFSAPQLLVYSGLPVLVVLAILIRGRLSRWHAARPQLEAGAESLPANPVSFSGKRQNGARSIEQENHPKSTKQRNDGHMLRIVTYHRVAEPESDTLLDPKIISATPGVFEQHMRFLSQSYDVVAMADVVAAIEEGAKLPRRALLITFDDAYCDFQDNAWPVLKQYRLPATVFVPTAYPDQNHRMFWWDRVYAAVMQTQLETYVAPALGVLSIASSEEKAHSVRRLQNYIKGLSHSDAVTFVDKLVAELSGPTTLRKTVLSWDELRALAAQGVTFGPHTQTHPIMTQLSHDEVRAEVVGSYQDLQRELGEVLPIFCYPNGGHDDDVVRILREEGFSAAFTTRDGHNDLGSVDPLRLTRTNVTRKSTLPVLRLRLQPWFAYIDKVRHRERVPVTHR